MIDNFEQIKKLLTFESEDDFYHLQILKRKKENPELGSNSYVVKTYYISSIDYLQKKKDEIIALCDFHNARACINLNRRSFERVAFNLLKKVTDQILNKDYRSVRKSYESVCGLHSSETNKKWIIDIDERDINLVKRVIETIETLEPIIPGSKVYDVIETKNGYHIITSPFKLIDFHKVFTIDIHKDNPTILYIP